MKYASNTAFSPTFLALSISASIAVSTFGTMGSVQAQSIHDALSAGTVTTDVRLRYEGVSQDNAAKDADALTFRTRLGYTSGAYEGFSVTVEMEDNRIVLGQGDYTVGPTGYNSGIYSVIADPEFTELDQGFVQYKNKHVTVKLGRQVIALDSQRFVGHVGWRQDRQTFDAATVIYAPSKALKTQYSHIVQRNRIFAESADLDTSDHLFNISYATALGKLNGYAYLLEVDNDTNNALDTYGVSFNGATKVNELPLNYSLEYATQTNESATAEYDTSYLFAEVGTSISGINAKFGYEVLGSDDGNSAFATPLATLHKFNGWSDQFLATPSQGLIDASITLSSKIASGNIVLAYHDFSADEPNATVDDLGNEINVQYTTKLADKYAIGIKYADYNAKDIKVDTQKLWIWLATKF
ncbi:MAG: alginate export family protein [Glaciecola sp.]|nr:alginate export family protein [Glaciecola sp.]MDG1468458.1 alginate export family protein [Glaciecola sp.]MDG1923123.1 alginate export family protein [Glaciecola sp.]